jgi:hypothetical protein
MGDAAAPPGIGGAASRYRLWGRGRSPGLAASVVGPPARPRLRGRVGARAMVVTRMFSDGRTDGRSDDGHGGVRDLDAL